MLYLQMKELFDSIQRKTLKFAQLPNRYLYFLNNSLIVYFSIG